ncbi:flagellar hook assembly protein FlgD [Candidatus Sumerlaeota bacterium]|nr:flagellar hook assembly protein FlgD [Candidatus Sumerlaeota bacterium]
MSISSVNSSLAAATTTSTKSSSSNSELGQLDFLNLLVTQLKNQDPLNPQDSAEFAAQLAQFSALEQMININDSFEDLTNAQSALSKLGTLNLIGNEVQLSTDTLTVADGEAAALEFSLEDDAENVAITFFDNTGNEINTYQLSDLTSGSNVFEWDGMDKFGQKVQDGDYSFTIVATDSSGYAVSAAACSTHIVTGVEFVNGEAYLQTASGLVSLSQVIAVQQPESGAE